MNNKETILNFLSEHLGKIDYLVNYKGYGAVKVRLTK